MTRRLLATATTALALLLFACGGGDAVSFSNGAKWSDSANMTMLNELPVYAGATLVREWEITDGKETIQVREYAVSTPAEQAADTVTLFYRDWLLKNGWTEAQPRAAFSAFTKGDSRFILGRVGPQLQEAPTTSKLMRRADPPANTGFYYTLEMTAAWLGSPPR